MFDIHGATADSIPVWFLNGFGLIWLIWTVSEFRAAYILFRYRGQVRRNTLDRLKMYTYVIITILWFAFRVGA